MFQFLKQTLLIFLTIQKNNYLKIICLKKTLYYVLFNVDNHIVASGGYGYNYKSNNVDLLYHYFFLVMGMVDRNYHKNGFGRRLTEFRIQKITTIYPELDILLNTTQIKNTFRKKVLMKKKKIWI